jgi:hypothetical protein
MDHFETEAAITRELAKVELPPMPTHPLEVVDRHFAQRLVRYAERVDFLEINTAQDAQGAADLLKEVTAAQKWFDEARLNLKRPWIELARAIDERAKKPLAKLLSIKSALDTMLSDWDVREKARLAEEERRRQEELRKLEAEKERQAKEAREKALAIAAEAAKANPSAEALDFDDAPAEPAPKSEIEKRIEAVKFAPAVVVQKPTGVRVTVTLVATVIDASKLPEQFIIRTANEAAIRATYCQPWEEGAPIPELPGVRFTIERKTSSTGRR